MVLRFAIRPDPRKLKATFGPGSGPEGRIDRLRLIVTALMRYERVEAKWDYCDEARGYAERLIQIAMKHGDRHKETMDMADFWLMEKDLIPKLFKVYVPRFSDTCYAKIPYTDIYRLPTVYRERRPPIQMGLLEFKGNPWPPVKPRQRDVEKQLHNVLLTEAKNSKYQRNSETQSSKFSLINKFFRKS